MSAKQLSTDALSNLIVAMNKYHNTLEIQIKQLKNAANVCSQAMGNDDLSKKYIDKLDDVIEEMNDACYKAEEAIALMKLDLSESADIYNSL